jgi:hypothetical protein
MIDAHRTVKIQAFAATQVSTGVGWGAPVLRHVGVLQREEGDDGEDGVGQDVVLERLRDHLDDGANELFARLVVDDAQPCPVITPTQPPSAAARPVPRA